MSTKVLVSLRLESVFVNKADSIAIVEDRSRNFVINKMLGEMIRSLEKKHGKIKINTTQLEKFRRKRRNRNKSSAKKTADKG